MNDEYAQCEKTAETTPIGEASALLSNAIDGLDKAMDCLRGKLAPVMLPAENCPPDDGVSLADQASPVRADIRAYTGRVESLREMVTAMTRRVEA